MTFLADRELRPVTLAEANGLHADGLLLGRGASALEVVLTSAAEKPSVHTLREAWKARVGGRATPVLLVTLYDAKAAVVGPSGDHPPAHTDLEPSKVERICAAALDEPDRHAALRFLNSVLRSCSHERPDCGTKDCLPVTNSKMEFPAVMIGTAPGSRLVPYSSCVIAIS
jgi:hypothetical protein